MGRMSFDPAVPLFGPFIVDTLMRQAHASKGSFLCSDG